MFCWTALYRHSTVCQLENSHSSDLCNFPLFQTLKVHIEAKTNGLHFPDDIFKCIFLNENVLISIKISHKFVPKGQINNIPALV